MMSMRTGHVDHVQLFHKNGLMSSVAIIMRGLQTSPPKSKNVLSTCFHTEKSAMVFIMPSELQFIDHHCVKEDNLSVPNMRCNLGVGGKCLACFWSRP